MRSPKKLLMVMIDGISADYFVANRARLPFLSQLADKGHLVQRLHSPMPATSMPGRASLLTGCGSDRHGVYGNWLWVDGAFRPPEADDVRVPTIAKLARDAGLDVACIGHALVRPQDTSVYVPPYWLRGAGFTKIRRNSELPDYLRVQDPSGRLADVSLPSFAPELSEPGLVGQVIGTLTGDQLTIGAVVKLLCSPVTPDFILTEIVAPDIFQHEYGYASEEAHFSFWFADALVGQCIESLRRHGRLDDFAVAIVSDHGHGPIDTAIHPASILPQMTWQTEGATLHVVVGNEAERQKVADDLAKYGVKPWNADHLPAAQRDQIAAFVAPPRHDFEGAEAGASSDQALGKPIYRSTHGFRPGTPEDDRLFLFCGPHVPKGTTERAAASSFAPTMAALLGLSLESFPDRPLFGADQMATLR